jgi:hypothetical protein
MVQTVKQFVTDAYQLISANTPTVPLQGNDMLKGVQFLNQLLKHYSATGLMLTVAKEVVYTLAIGQSTVTFADPDYTGIADVKTGRLANLADAWLLLDNVTYPLIIENRDVFQGSYKFDPQVGLPRFVIVYNETDLTRLRLYPGASQVYELHVYGKFELSVLTENDDMSSLPLYYQLFFQFAVARYLAAFKGRAAAWTQFLQDQYNEAKQDMESVSAVNVVIQSTTESLLNGAFRVRAGI